MIKWQYACVEWLITNLKDRADLADKLGELGQDGWELVAVNVIESKAAVMAWLKRPIEG